MWPALILAAKRTPKVKGRTATLTVSIKTRKGLRGAGEPTGKNPAQKEPGLRQTLDKIKDNQNTKAKEKVRTRCLETPNT